MGESALHRPDALAQRHQNRGVGPEGPEGKVYILSCIAWEKGITALLHLAAGGPPFHIGEEIPGLLHSNMQLSWFFRQG